MRSSEVKKAPTSLINECSSQKVILESLVSFLDIEMLGSFKATSKTLRRAVRKCYAGVYLRFDHFVSATSGHYNDKWVCWYAWVLYQQTIDSTNLNAAAIYSRKDKDKKIDVEKAIIIKSDPSRLYSSGLYYHSWEFNLSWILAQIHKGRSFKLLSNPKHEYFFQNKPKNDKQPTEAKDIYSGYALEIAAALKAKYVIKSDAETNEISLVPTLCDKDRIQLTIDDIYPDVDDVEKVISLLLSQEESEELEHSQIKKMRQA